MPGLVQGSLYMLLHAVSDSAGSEKIECLLFSTSPLLKLEELR